MSGRLTKIADKALTIHFKIAFALVISCYFLNSWMRACLDMSKLRSQLLISDSEPN